MAAAERARLIALLQSARPMRLFRNCRSLSAAAMDEILTLTAGDPDDGAVAAVGAVARRAKQTPLTDGRRIPSAEIDELLARLGA
jgi:hypothetical protein